MLTAPGTSVRRRTLSPHHAFWLQASVLVVFMAASSAPTPLYPVYQSMWGFPPVVLTTIFAVYALALLAALLIVGSLSDYLGRRPVLLVSLGVEILSMLLFAVAENAVVLVVARVIQGVATGTVMGAIGAYLIELGSSVRDGLGAVINGAGPMMGLAVRALVSSLIIAAAPESPQLIYVIILAILLIQTLGMLLSPETVAGRPGAVASLRPHVRFPAAARRSVLWVLPAAAAAWALGGLMLSLAPNVVRSMAGEQSVVLTGLIVAALTGTGGLSVILLGRVNPLRILTLGMVALLVGLTATLAAVGTGCLETAAI